MAGNFDPLNPARVTTYLLHFVQPLTREKANVPILLFLSFSGFCQTDLFRAPSGATSADGVTGVTTEELAPQSVDAPATS